jgi:hypothetical protein
MLCDQDQEEDDFDNRAERSFDEDARDLWHLASKFLPCEAEEVRYRYHGDVCKAKDRERFSRCSIVKYDSYRHERPQQIDVFCGIAAATPGDVEEVS